MDDNEKTIKFLLEQQAAAAVRYAEAEAQNRRWQVEHEARNADDESRRRKWENAFQENMQAIEQEQIRFQGNMQAMEQEHARFQGSMRAIEQTQVRQLEMINRLIDLSAQHERRLDETQEKLDALIAIVDGVVRRKE